MLLLLWSRLVRKAADSGPGLSPMLDANIIYPDDIVCTHRTFSASTRDLPLSRDIFSPALTRLYSAALYCGARFV